MEKDSQQVYNELKNRFDSVVEQDGTDSALEKLWIDLKSKFEEYEDQLRDFKQNLSQKDEATKHSQHDYEVLMDKYVRKCDESDRLRNELKLNDEESSLLQNRLKESQQSVADAQSQILPLKLQISRAEQDNKYLQERLQSTETELSQKQRLLADEKALSLNGKFDFETKLTECQTELDFTKDRLKSAQDQISLLSEKVLGYQSKIRELENSNATLNEKYLNESENLRRVNQLQKAHLDEANNIISDLENNLNALKDSHKDEITQMLYETNSTIDRLKFQFDNERNDYLQKIEELHSQIKDLLNPPKNIVTTIADEEDSGKQIQILQNELGTNIYELYDKIISLEKEKQFEFDKRKEAEIHLQHVLKDVESKAPILAEQKRNYQRLVESHDFFSKRFDELQGKNAQLMETVSNFENSQRQLLKNKEILEQHNKDLCKQIQNLLKNTMASGSTFTPSKNPSSNDAIGEYLVSYDGIEELQLRNAQLLQTIRKLEKDIDDDKAHIDEKAQIAANTALNAAMKEISAMRDQRQHTENLMNSLVQQRDLYKAMIQEAGILGSPISHKNNQSVIPIGDIHSTPRTPFIGRSSMSPGNRTVDEFQGKLAAAEEEKMKLRDRISRLEEAEKLLSDALDSMRTETSKLRMDAAMNASEAKFNKDRVTQLEEAMKLVTAENAAGLQRRLDIEKLVLEYQHASRSKDEQMRQLIEKLNSSQEQHRLALVELEASKSTEKRLQDQLSHLRDELKRSATLSESVQRIEMGLSSKMSEEKISLVAERDSALAQLEVLKQQMQEISSNSDSKLISLNQELVTLRSSLEEKRNENDTLKQSLIREEKSVSTLSDRTQSLENQLQITQDRLFASQGISIVESVVEKKANELQLALDQANAQISSLKQQLEVAESHADDYRKLSASTDTMLKELQGISAAAKASYEADVSRLEDNITTLRHELTASNQSLNTFISEIEQAREEARKTAKQLADAQSQYEDTITAKNLSISQLEKQIEHLKFDVVKFQGVAKASHKNYENELLLHANAEKELREARDQFDVLNAAMEAEKQKSSSLSIELARKEHELQDQKATFAATIQENEKAISDLKNVNDLLHSQVHSLSEQVDKMMTDRGSTTEEGNTDAKSSEDNGSNVREMRNTITELREVVRYIKRERDVLSSKQTASEGEVTRLRTELNSAHHILDELRSQVASLSVKLNAEKSVGKTPEEINRLVQDSQQSALLRDSNSHLRQVNEELMKRVNTLEADVKMFRERVAPLEEKLQQITSEKNALEASCKQDAADAVYWRERLQQLVKRYNEIDPEEHRILKEKFAVSSSQLTESLDTVKSLKEALQEAENKGKELASAKESEIQQLKNTYDASEKNATILRTKLRDFKTKYDEVVLKLTTKTKSESDLNTQVSDLNKQLSSMTSDIESLKSQLSAAQSAIPPKVSTASSSSQTNTVSRKTTPLPAGNAAAASAVGVSKAPVVATVPAPLDGDKPKEPSPAIEAVNPTTEVSTVPPTESGAMDVIQDAAASEPGISRKRPLESVSSTEISEGDSTKAVSTTEQESKTPSPTRVKTAVPVETKEPEVKAQSTEKVPETTAKEAQLLKMKEQLLQRKKALGTAKSSVIITKASSQVQPDSESAGESAKVEEEKQESTDSQVHKKLKVEDNTSDIFPNQDAASSSGDVMEISPPAETANKEQEMTQDAESAQEPKETDESSNTVDIPPPPVATKSTTESAPEMKPAMSIFSSAFPSQSAASTQGTSIFGSSFIGASGTIAAKGPGIFGSTFMQSNTPSATGVTIFGSATASMPFGKGIKPITTPATKPPIEEGQLDEMETSAEMTAFEEGFDSNKEDSMAGSSAVAPVSPFLNLRPPSPSGGGGSIPSFGFGKGSLPKPALLTGITSTAPAAAVAGPFSKTSAASATLFRRQQPNPLILPTIPSSESIAINAQSTVDKSEKGAQLEAISEEEVADKTSVVLNETNVETSSKSNVEAQTKIAEVTPGATGTTVKRKLPTTTPKKIVKVAGSTPQAERLEQRAMRFSEGSGSAPAEVNDGPTDASAATATTTTVKPKGKATLKPKAKLGTLVRTQAKPSTAPGDQEGGDASAKKGSDSANE